MEVRKTPEWKNDAPDIETGTSDIALSIAEIYGLLRRSPYAAWTLLSSIPVGSEKEGSGHP